MLFCLVGPSAGGKTSMGNYLLKTYADSITRAISATTRAKRDGEVEGEDYYFLTKTEFEQRVAAGDFYEWAEVHGNLYGTLKSVVSENLQKGKCYRKSFLA